MKERFRSIIISCVIGLIVLLLVGRSWILLYPLWGIDTIPDILTQHFASYGRGDYSESFKYMLSADQGGKLTLEELSYWGSNIRFTINKLTVTHVFIRPLSLTPRARVYATVEYGGSQVGECQELQAFLALSTGEWKVIEVIRITPGYEEYPLSPLGCDLMK